jgi:hypothetical protein
MGFNGGASDYVIENTVFFAGTTGICARYTRTAGQSLGNADAWRTFDTGPLRDHPSGFSGAVVCYTADDSDAGPTPGSTSQPRGALFVPSDGDVAALYRYHSDDPGDFADTASWQTFKLTKANPNYTGFGGAIVDTFQRNGAEPNGGNYVYLIPQSHTLLVRWNSRTTFDDKNNWQDYCDLGNMFPDGGFSAATFDGTYIYLGPRQGGPPVRFKPGVLRSLDTLERARSSVGPTTSMIWDGRYVYFSGPSSTVYRYDSQGSFGTDRGPPTATDLHAWDFFDFKRGDSDSSWGFDGMVMDGRYLYFAPSNSEPVVRFDARYPEGPVPPTLSWPFR